MDYNKKNLIKFKLLNSNLILINPLTWPGEGVCVFTYPYLSAGAPALGKAKGLINQ